VVKIDTVFNLGAGFHVLPNWIVDTMGCRQ